ncbi:hypothetical protein MYAM1_001399 [Malassezia yamatoensis]|uniref:Protein BIG1 n=1 Tax=Malassezia yamatoensis TaxID=253288 RepID=A0AAJ6CFV8_9BASI|nr:hypothetical protein MYAM1_001399 [Malassezia yamatoensis]
MRSIGWLALVALACGTLVSARDAPLMAYLSTRSESNLLRVPSYDAIASRGPQVSAGNAVSRLMHHCDSNGVPEMCNLDGIVHLEVEAPDHSTFAQLIDSHAALRKRALQSPHQLILPGLDQSEQRFGEALEQKVQAMCPGWRKASSLDHDFITDRTLLQIDTKLMSTDDIAAALERIEQRFPSHAVIVSASSPRKLNKRYIPVKPEDMRAQGKFLEQYQLFSSATILTLGVASFLLFFVLVAVHLLSSTETPDRLGTGKGPSQEKKRQ